MPQTLPSQPDGRASIRAYGPFASVQDQIELFNERHGHPYALLRETVTCAARPHDSVLDIGCGRTAPMLRQLADKVARCTGVDIVPFDEPAPGLTLINADVAAMPQVPDGSVDIAYSRSVMEHLADPQAALREIHRVLKPGGRYIFLTPNKWDYASVASRLIPDRWHPKLVRWVSGRPEADTFPTHYRANTCADLRALAAATGFTVERMSYHGQYPAYLKFNPLMFWLGCRYEALLSGIPALSRFQGWIFADWRKADA